MYCVCAESNGKSSDVELNQTEMFATNQVTDPDGNKNFSGSVRRSKQTKKVQWKDHISGKTQQGSYCMEEITVLQLTQD